jgi:hypothetical protein
MIGKILASGELGKLASFVSPTFFDVMPSRALWAKGKSLLSQSRDREAFRHAVATRSSTLAAQLPEVELKAERVGAASGSAPADWRAARVAELYFHQLFHGDVTLLDLRASAFTAVSPSRLIWHPSTWQTRWAPEFISALRDMYRGFYARDEAAFARGLRALDLEHSADLFRQQFGGEQRAMRFKTADFVRSFHEVFGRCKRAGTRLHPDFLALGIYLAALYDHLEELAVPVDVAVAFERALPKQAPRPAEMSHA